MTTRSTKKDEKPEAVTYESPATRKRVYSPDGVQVAQFVDGEFTTDDPDVQKALDGLPDVRRA